MLKKRELLCSLIIIVELFSFSAMLATPISVARPKRLLDTADVDYSHVSQTRWSNFDVTTNMATTWNTTRTFDSKGHPKDADND